MVHIIVADVLVMLPAFTALIVGIDAGVENVKFVEVAVPPESVETAAKS